ncbi:hypothetical protein RIF29_19518 [Crotalaria pallida]|uniref:Legume lectin domain-containing protein n=1 Tax=Crotalaria pallida TaxID=3830 RepID=A0AAN9I7T0_CROPI
MANPFLSQKPFSALLSLFLTFFLLSSTKVNSAASGRHTISNFTSDYVLLGGDAESLNNGNILELTNRADNLPGTGRAVYNFVQNMWHDATGNYASFVTTFSFKLSHSENCEGLVFFMEPQDQQILPENSGGGNLGIVDAYKGLNQFVAVEFDASIDEWDPDYKHIGINVNSVVSLKTAKWEGYLVGRMNNVTISYDSLSKILSVTVIDSATIAVFNLAQVIDLKAVLPQKIRLGFSATSKGHVA